MEAIPMRMRKGILADCQSGMKNTAVAAKWNVSLSFVVKLKRRVRETGTLEPKQGKTGPKPKLAPHYKALLRIIKKHPDATLFEIRDLLPIKVLHQTIANALIHLQISYKKKRFMPPNKTDQTSQKNARNGKTNRVINRVRLRSY